MVTAYLAVLTAVLRSVFLDDYISDSPQLEEFITIRDRAALMEELRSEVWVCLQLLDLALHLQEMGVLILQRDPAPDGADPAQGISIVSKLLAQDLARLKAEARLIHRVIS